MKIHVCCLLLIGSLFACTISRQESSEALKQDIISYVNPLMGTASTFKFSHGNVYPAICRPWGMNFWTPQTGGLGSGWIYQYHKDSINGFRQTHQPSPWMNDYGTFALMPVTGKLKTRINKRASRFSHDREIVQPGYYEVYLQDYEVTAKMTASERAAMLKFEFPETEDAYIILDIFNKGGEITLLPDQKKITGSTTYSSGGVPDNFANYFVIKFSVPFSGYGTWSGDDIFKNELDILSINRETGAYIRFDTRDHKNIKIKVASSFISSEQAELNLQQDTHWKSFDELREEGSDAWKKELSRIIVEGGTEEQRRTFYSTLYRSLLFPRRFYEYDNDENRMYYSPFDGRIHNGYMYADDGFWDTFRAVFPFYTIMYPSMDATMMQWIVNAYHEGGWLPIWPSPGYRKVMIGVHSASLFADALVKGIKDFDTEGALNGMLQDAFKVAPEYAPGRDGVNSYNKLGYVPYPDFREASAKTLEYAYDDFCVMQCSRILGYDSLAEIFKQRAYNYKNVFDKQSLLMRGRSKDGTFIRDFSPLAWGGPFTEGNAWHYTWSVFHDPQGLIDLMGGRKMFVTMLDSVFSQSSRFEVGTYPYEIHEITEMVAAGMGQYAHGNQPIQHMIYLYNYAGKPARCQYWVREILNRLYKPEPDGYCGDEDNGQTSVWYVFSALGFYPVCPGSSQYILGSPLFDKATLKLENGKIFIIQTYNNSSDNRYVKEVRLNGRKYKKCWISQEDIMNGGILEFTMSDKPSNAYSDNPEDLPFSMSLKY